MPWKIVPARYDPTDPMTLHDDEILAIESALSRGLAPPMNEYSARWRAWKKIHPLAAACDGTDDPTSLLPPGAAGNPNFRDIPDDADDGQPLTGPL